MPEVLRTLGRYDIVREIGRGGMAIVYLARQTDLDRVVALKELAAFHAADPAFAERFVRESRIAGSLSHPNIVTVHDFIEHEGTPYIAMEYVEGGSLRPLVPHLTLAQCAGVLESILAGLAHAEARGIVHRDLKPENVMVTADGSVKIADFGIAKAINQVATAHLSATGSAMGTPAYMAPEQALAKDIGPWTDLYSTGVIAYELLVGRLPFDDRTTPMALLVKHIQEPIPPPLSLNPDLDPRLAAWLERMLEKDPERRPRGAAEAWDELEEIVISILGPRWRREARLGAAAFEERRRRPSRRPPSRSRLRTRRHRDAARQQPAARARSAPRRPTTPVGRRRASRARAVRQSAPWERCWWRSASCWPSCSSARATPEATTQPKTTSTGADDDRAAAAASAAARPRSRLGRRERGVPAAGQQPRGNDRDLRTEAHRCEAVSVADDDISDGTAQFTLWKSGLALRRGPARVERRHRRDGAQGRRTASSSRSRPRPARTRRSRNREISGGNSVVFSLTAALRHHRRHRRRHRRRRRPPPPPPPPTDPEIG